ncbi:MAG: hypothetical protein NZL87_04420, partial [Thermomicrobium sp.]|nr:hypothetical protein [Thermomicrobium sp.]
MTELLGSELSVSDARSLLDRSRRITRLPSGIERRPCSIGGVLCEWLLPDKAEPRFLIVYLHGGGFVLGRTALHLGLA